MPHDLQFFSRKLRLKGHFGNTINEKQDTTKKNHKKELTGKFPTIIKVTLYVLTMKFSNNVKLQFLCSPVTIKVKQIEKHRANIKVL